MQLRNMRLIFILPTILLGGVYGFAPSAQRCVSRCNTINAKTTLGLAIDPLNLIDAFHHITSATTMMLSDAVDVGTMNDVATAVVDTTASTAVDTANAAATVAIGTANTMNDVAAAAAAAADAPTDYGWFGFLTVPIEGLLKIIHSLIAATGTANSWGVSIIALTLLIKLLTFPLTKTQLESTNKMQAMQPAIKEIQLKYQSNPEVMNQKIAEFYQVNEINPLAGCLPSLVQIPVFIGLYRAVLELAKQDTLNERFLFLPSLEGPTYGADPATASDWILKGW
jgi:YidC/Oxa1 family membrane protein insertase